MTIDNALTKRLENPTTETAKPVIKRMIGTCYLTIIELAQKPLEFSRRIAEEDFYKGLSQDDFSQAKLASDLLRDILLINSSRSVFYAEDGATLSKVELSKFIKHLVEFIDSNGQTRNFDYQTFFIAQDLIWQAHNAHVRNSVLNRSE